MKEREEEEKKDKEEKEDKGGSAAAGGRFQEVQAAAAGGKGGGGKGGKGKEGERGGKHKSEAVAKKKKEADFRPGQKKMLAMMMKQVLKNSQTCREIVSCIAEVVTIQADGAECKGMRLQTAAYQQKVEQGEPPMFPPHLVAFAGLLDAIVEKGEVTVGSSWKDVKFMKDEYDNFDTDHRIDMCKMCKNEKMFRTDLRKVSLVIVHPRCERLLEALVALGAQRKMGKAPAGYMERDLQEWLQAIE